MLEKQNKQLQMDLDNATPFVVNENDYIRWNKQMKAIYQVLQDGNWHTREELQIAASAKEPASRVSELRKKGFIIDCQRITDTGATVYKIEKYVGYDTTKQKHCYCCRFNDDYVENYTG
tara:strand:- start:7479 stop:7835 length:357 start_codon:yes stop_codon:yes gene_type:complete